jgi:hypothetical protein
MSQRAQRAVKLLSWSAAATLACSLAAAQNSAPPSVAEQLEAQYKRPTWTKDSNGNAVFVEGTGTQLAIQKQGIAALPLTNPLNPCASTYTKGRLEAPGFLCQVAIGVGSGNDTPTVNLAVGQKAYPASIAVDTRRDTVRFVVIACEPCNGNDPPTYYKAEVDFRFPRGLLASGDASQVEDTIGQVFSIDNSASAEAAAQGQGAQAGAAPAASAAPAPEPVNVQQGQTIAEVEQALGKPLKILTVSNKVIYVYHDLKVTFTNGKVADVQ